MRWGNLKLITVHAPAGKSPWGGYLKGDALFDVVADPGERNNLIDDPEYEDAQAPLRRLLDEWWSPVDAHLGTQKALLLIVAEAGLAN